MFYTLQSFRGLAAVAVAAFHLSIGLGDPRFFGFKVFEAITWRMNLGVDFFFVLSGFIIMAAHNKDIGEPSRLIQFLKKRFVRIYPIYWFCTGIFCALIALGFGSVAKNPDTVEKWISVITLIRLDNFLLPISPAWTLMHEVAFYAVFSIFIVNRKAGIIAFALWLTPCLMLFTYPTPSARTPFATYFSAYNIEFLIGMGTYVLFQKRILPRPITWVSIGLFMFFTILYMEKSRGGEQIPSYQFFYALCFGAIIYGSVTWEAQLRAIRFGDIHIPLLPFLGDASYSIYLTHIAFEGFLTKLVLKTVPAVIVFPKVAYIAILFLTVIAGSIVHIIVEKPLLRFGRSTMLDSKNALKAY